MIGSLNFRGVLISVFIALISMVLAHYSPPILNSVMWALLLGVLMSNAINLPNSWDQGISFTSSKMLEWSIIFLAFGIDYRQIAALGAWGFFGVLVTVLVVLITTIFLARKFNCPTNTGILVGFGTAICGSSAIAALAPSLPNGEKEDVAISMAVVNLLGTAGMILMPLLLIEFHWSSSDMGFLVGGTLHSVGNVAGAGFAMGKEAGDIALTVKLARVALLTPALILMGFLNRSQGDQGKKISYQLPWYLIGFIFITVVISWIDIPKEILKNTTYLGNVILTIAMAAIGLKVNFKKLIQSGKKGLRFGLVIFAVQTLVLLLVLQLIK